MAHAFPPIPAKPAFGSSKESLYQSDYLTRKKAKIAYCSNNAYCNRIITSDSYDNINLYKLGLYVTNLGKCNTIPFNKGNLVMGLYSKMNLQGVCTVIEGPPCVPNSCDACNTSPVIPDPSTFTEPFCENYVIDPVGELFGTSQCGELNYTGYMVPVLPNGIIN
jgi:hypothetical protein